jgi:hypothetical protein
MFLTRCSPAGAKPKSTLPLTWFVDGARDADRARVSQAFEAPRDVHAIAIDVVVLDDHVAEVDADPERDALVRRALGLVLGHGALDLGGREHRAHCARELDQRAVAGQLDDAALWRPIAGSIRSRRRVLSLACVPASSASISRL